MKRNSIHFRAGDFRPGTGRRRHQAPWRNVSEMSETSKQWSHPGSCGAKRRQDRRSPFTLTRESPAVKGRANSRAGGETIIEPILRI